jgi:ribonucleoside-diphosphate reductase alpha subunit
MLIVKNNCIEEYDENKLLKSLKELKDSDFIKYDDILLQIKQGFPSKQFTKNELIELSYLTQSQKKLLCGLFQDNEILNLSFMTFKAFKTYVADIIAARVSHNDYYILGGKFLEYCISKKIKNFEDLTDKLFKYENDRGKSPLIRKEVRDIIKKNINTINELLKHNTYEIDYFGQKTLEKGYLKKMKNEIVFTKKELFILVSIGINTKEKNMNDISELYKAMCEGKIIFGSPTLFNSYTISPQCSSCFLLGIEDSIKGIFKTLSDTGKISAKSGGIGVSVSDVRGKGAYIKGSDGYSDGVVPMFKVYNDTARYVNQGGGKRKGAFAMYIEPWHSDIFDVLKTRTNTGDEESKSRDLHQGLWIPDLFMKRVKSDEHWTLFSPDIIMKNNNKGLTDVYDSEFDELYQKYENLGLGKRIKARDLWFAIIDAQIETGEPYMLYKDACNKKSNQKNIGVIKSSNLCTEILEYTSKDEIAVCNLSSLGLKQFVKYKNNKPYFDFEELGRVTRIAAKSLDKIIDVNIYPCPEAEYSNKKHRPVGIGVQGLADVFLMMCPSFTSEESKILNVDIFQTIYYYALKESMERAKKYGPYETFEGSPASKGILQFDMWNGDYTEGNLNYNWDSLKKDIMKYGLRNSLLCAAMPTASCVPSYTKILTSNGIETYRDIMNKNNIDWKKIEKSNVQSWYKFEKPIDVKTRHGNKKSKRIYYNGYKPIYNIKLENGKTIKCTANHKFLVNRNNNKVWIRADEIKENDDIVTI